MKAWFGKVARIPLGMPFTTTMVALLWLLGVASGSLWSGPSGAVLDKVGFGFGQWLRGQWWTPFTSTFWSGGLAQYVGNTILVAVLCGFAERHLSTVRTMSVFLITQVLGTTATAVLVIGSGADEWWSADLLSAVEVGPSAGAVGVAVAATSALSAVWRRRLRLIVLLAVIMLALYVGSLIQLSQVFAALIGLTLGMLTERKSAEEPSPPSRGEARLLVALAVAASAVGPLVAAVSQTASGPLSVFQYLLVGSQPDLAFVDSTCADPSALAECRRLRAEVRMNGLGSALMSVVPVVLLLVLAEGLRRGRKFAWWATIALNLALAGLGAVLFTSYTDEPLPRSTSDWVQTLAPLVQPAAILVLLVVTRAKFDVSAPRGTYRRFAGLASKALLICSVVYVWGAYLLRDQFEPAATIGGIVTDLPTRFAPPGYLGAIETAVLPNGWLATMLHQWIGVIFWLVVLTGGLITFRKAIVERRASDRARARELLESHGGTSMSHMITWPGNDYWFAPDGHAVIAYRVISSVALTTGEPVGAPAARGAAAQEFSRFCARNGWTPCFYGITDELRQDLPSWNSVQVAEETLVPLKGLEFKGKKWQDIRTAMNKAQKSGVIAEWLSYVDAPPWMSGQIKTLSRDWLADKGLPEMRFTLGGLDELADPDVRCLVAVDDKQHVHGVTSWLPVRDEGRIVAWTLDFMRRGPDAFPGVMEFLIASMVVRCRDEGSEYLSLSGAPLARLDRDEQTAPPQRLLDVVGKTLEPVYGFRSLLAFKAKFQPTYLPLYMAYPRVAALPSVGNAIAKAYLPRITFKQAFQLIGKVLIRR
ncbi:rhomboid family intramembrane serine protease [Amycolatopsis sp. NPDC057786]|uniref:rhomboid family intramembrane serine protease n=1 Tax=Amycolatopsis sp. NPDC057786 TaxID=3346250 RepID=UPI00366EE88F